MHRFDSYLADSLSVSADEAIARAFACFRHARAWAKDCRFTTLKFMSRGMKSLDVAFSREA